MRIRGRIRFDAGCWMGLTAVLLTGCAHDPAPKARCHGPWVWVNAPVQPAPAAGISPNPNKGLGSTPRSSAAGVSSDSVPPAQPGHR
jgi:hypothetical protein